MTENDAIMKMFDKLGRRSGTYDGNIKWVLSDQKLHITLVTNQNCNIPARFTTYDMRARDFVRIDKRGILSGFELIEYLIDISRFSKQISGARMKMAMRTVILREMKRCPTVLTIDEMMKAPYLLDRKKMEEFSRAVRQYESRCNRRRDIR